MIWRDGERGQGGQFGGEVAFSPDGKYLYLSSGDRQRMTPSQDPNQPLGKILRLTLDGKPAPGNPMAGKIGAATGAVIDPPENTETGQDRPCRPNVHLSRPQPDAIGDMVHRASHSLWSGLRTGWPVVGARTRPARRRRAEPDRTRQKLWLPLVSYGHNYDGVPIPSPDTRPDLTKPVIDWVPVIAPGNLVFYKGAMFSQWNGSALASGLISKSLTLITFDGKGGATPADRWDLGFRVRDVEVAPDGALWIIEDARSGGLYRATAK